MAADSCTVVARVANVSIGNVALVAPPAMKTLRGTRAESGWLLPKVMCTPTAGAGPPSVTVPVDGVPPTTVFGDADMLVSGGSVGYTVNTCDNVTPPPVTAMVTAVASDTAVVVMLKKPVPLPADNVAVLGTAATAGLLLVTRTV
jgi:hypothetical protein